MSKAYKRWRLRHTDARNKIRLEYYRKHNYGYGKRKYTIEEVLLILAHIIPDVELGKKISRSVEAIQITRYKVKDLIRKGKYENILKLSRRS